MKQLWTRIWNPLEGPPPHYADYAPSMGAALACDTMLSIAPLLFLVILPTGRAFGEEAVSAPADVCRPQAIHSTLLTRKHQKATARRRLDIEAISRAARPVTTMVGH
jgi:hypothetical protein